MCREFGRQSYVFPCRPASYGYDASDSCDGDSRWGLSCSNKPLVVKGHNQSATRKAGPDRLSTGFPPDMPRLISTRSRSRHQFTPMGLVLLTNDGGPARSWNCRLTGLAPAYRRAGSRARSTRRNLQRLRRYSRRKGVFLRALS